MRLAVLAAGWCVAGCRGQPTAITSDANVESGTLTLARDIQPILDANCTRCHALGAGEPHGNPHFTADASRTSLAGTSECTSNGVPVRYVVAGQTEDSFVMFKLGAPSNLVIADMKCAETMPYNADSPLADSDPQAVDVIRRWILDGAPP